jgi:type I restriction enzyme R subunit
MSREQLIGLIQADAKFMDERDDITDYVRTLKAGEGLSETAIRDGYTRFKDEKKTPPNSPPSRKARPRHRRLQTFVDAILQRMIFDGEQLTDLMEAARPGWKAREKELALMEDLVPLLTKRAQGRDISGLSAV